MSFVIPSSFIMFGTITISIASSGVFPSVASNRFILVIFTSLFAPISELDIGISIFTSDPSY